MAAMRLGKTLIKPVRARDMVREIRAALPAA